MKSILGPLCTLLLFIVSPARAYVTGIYDIWSPEKDQDYYLILATDGRVFEAPADQRMVIEKLQLAKETKEAVNLFLQNHPLHSEILESRSSILDVELMSYPLLDDDIITPPQDGGFEYMVTTFANMSNATRYFNLMRRNTRQKSQCYNRAMVWTYELEKYHGIGLNKNWMFFTRRYIREFRYHWWFHVTPYTNVEGQGPVAFDRVFTRAPLPIVPWKNIFMRNKADCPLVSNYSSYHNNQEAAYCYWMRTSRYFWQPWQIEYLERGRPAPTGWVPAQLNTAYRDAVD